VRIAHHARLAKEAPRECHVDEAEQRREQTGHRVTHRMQPGNVTAAQVAQLIA